MSLNSGRSGQWILKVMPSLEQVLSITVSVIFSANRVVPSSIKDDRCNTASTAGSQSHWQSMPLRDCLTSS